MSLEYVIFILMQPKPEVTATITQTVVKVVSKVHDAPAVATWIVALLTYIQDIFMRREVVKQRKH